MHTKSTGTSLLIGALILFNPTISLAARLGPGTLIETRPYETDEHITEKVKQEFAKDKVLKARDINIKTDHASVILTGAVRSKKESGRAYAIVKRIPEVDKVRNNLKITSN